MMGRRWFEWGDDFNPRNGDRIWQVGARDQEFHEDAWTIVCCDRPMTDVRESRLVCGACGNRLAQVPFRSVAPQEVA